MVSGGDNALMEKIGGKVIKFGDSVNTDVIIPGRYLVSIDPQELAKHAFEPLGPEVQKRLWSSQVLVGGTNFGCGSAREQAASCLSGAGIKAVVAKSFARVFFRNCINTGLPVVECPEAVEAASDGGELWMDLERGIVDIQGKNFRFASYPESLKQILEAGGLIPYLAKYVLPQQEGKKGG
jgi:3-isopropylmalate/(R)-2-methylmalate dehydratase small subunit